MVFKSAVDGWFYALLVAIPLAVFVPVLPLLRSGNTAVLSALTVTTILALGLPLWLLLTTQYTVTKTSLLVKSGPFAWRIPRAEIVSVTPSRSALSSPALSLDRLEIRYGKRGSLLVSPRDKAAFIAALDLPKTSLQQP